MTKEKESDMKDAEMVPEKDAPQIPEHEVTISELAKKILATDKQYDLSKILSAYQLAESAHAGQTRSSGEPYIIHPLAVADILLDLGMDTDTICVGLLHDVVEDTDYTLDDIRKKFGQDVAVLVDGVTKLNRIPLFDKEQQQANNVRKILLAMSHDIRVMIIKLADRIHNMRTLKYLPPEKQRRIALETMNVYAPIAHRLGIRTVKDELEDLAFYYLDSYAYSEIEHIMEIKKDEREAFIESIKDRIRKRLAQEQFAKEPIIEGRVKSIYGIYKKSMSTTRAWTKSMTNMQSVSSSLPLRNAIWFWVLCMICSVRCPIGSKTTFPRRNPICTNPCTPPYWDGKAFPSKYKSAPGICMFPRNTESLPTGSTKRASRARIKWKSVWHGFERSLRLSRLPMM